MMLKSLTSASRPLMANVYSDGSTTSHRLFLGLISSMSRAKVHLPPCFKHNYNCLVLTSEFHRSSSVLMSSGTSNAGHQDDDAKIKLVSSSTIFLQDELTIRELPILVQTAATAHFCADDVDVNDVDNRTAGSSSVDGWPADQKSARSAFTKYDAVTEVAAVQDGLKKCNSLSEIFELLEVIPVEEVTPRVATFALHRIATLQVSDLPSNSFLSSPSSMQLQHNAEGSCTGLMDTFAWRAIVDRLINTICLSKSAKVLLEGLKAVILVRKFAQAPAASADGKTGVLDDAVDRLVRECMSIVAKGKMSIDDTCDLARTLNSISKTPSSGTGNLLNHRLSSSKVDEIDKLWLSFVDKSNSIDESNVALVYATLPLLRNSRKFVLELLQKRMHAFWWKLKASDVLVILDVLRSIRFAPSSFLTSFTKWFSLSVHTLTESDVSKVVASLRRLDHFDDNIGCTLERYVKARSKNIDSSFEDPEVVANICDFCVHFRYSSPVILDTLALWFASTKHHLMSADQIFRVARTFGLLNHVPTTTAIGRPFFAALEESIDSRFVMFRPEDLVELLLSCTHIQRYPLNFVRRLFSPFFLDRLNAIQDEFKRCRATQSLRLLDNAMTLECPHYEGPMLHEDRSAKSVRRDGRLTRFHSWLDDDFADVLGGQDKFVTMECLPNLCLSDIYICDYMFNLDENDSPLPYYKKGSGIRKKKAVIVHLPEDYMINLHCLVGQQTARVRHLKKLGYDIVQFDHHELQNLRMRQSTERLKYLRKKLFL